MCDCLKITFGNVESGLPNLSFEMPVSGMLNGYNYYQFIYFGTTYYVWHNATDNWYISQTLGSSPYKNELKANEDPCPIAESPVWTSASFYTKTEECEAGCGNEDRYFKEYGSIRLPKTCIEEDRGYTDCCCEQLVLANAGSDSWKNDKTAVWIKLSSVADTFNFKLYKDGVLTSYVLSTNAFVNEPNAYYSVINWYDVLISDGIGCYELRRDWDISEITGSDIWGLFH